MSLDFFREGGRYGDDPRARRPAAALFIYRSGVSPGEAFLHAAGKTAASFAAFGFSLSFACPFFPTSRCFFLVIGVGKCFICHLLLRVNALRVRFFARGFLLP
jgi:hypothetical protein